MGRDMGALHDGHRTPSAGRRRTRWSAAILCFVAALACWQPVAAAARPAAGAQIGAEDEMVPYESADAPAG